ncbi:hypothetical protein [Rhizobium sp. Root1204]|uniref:hypothetical protein n=1 Tax=Rhizobium sp. Root1204 TaxID=1736428 RepID=UPI000712942F|nr:hypothetical protein [Rhizobium sp. Root1204]KQV28835.1 hypothetical protein ASC96_15820 [Rhizobium sp. Root1204]
MPEKNHTQSVKLALTAKARSDQSVARIQSFKLQLADKLRKGILSQSDADQLGLASFCRQAGVGENFLNGPLYKDSLKNDIKLFIARIKASYIEKQKEGHSRLSAEHTQADTEVALNRLKDMLHAARIQLHAKRQIIKSLSQRNSPTVVSLKPKAPP